MITGVLNSAAGILSNGNPYDDRAACSELNVLAYQLSIRAQYNQLTQAQAAQLIQSIQAIEKAQGCIPSTDCGNNNHIASNTYNSNNNNINTQTGGSTLLNRGIPSTIPAPNTNNSLPFMSTRQTQQQLLQHQQQLFQSPYQQKLHQLPLQPSHPSLASPSQQQLQQQQRMQQQQQHQQSPFYPYPYLPSP
jgi:hypothetical protein